AVPSTLILFESGPRLAASRKAYHNLERALPEGDYDTIIAGMWDNLGRVICEYPHLARIARERVRIEGLENLPDPSAGNVIFISAHMANWEINCAAPLVQLGLAVDVTYRAPNNPYVAAILEKIRSFGGRLQAYPKSRSGGRALMKAVREGRNIGILIDQKYNEGVEASFFNQPAMTNPIFVQLAQKFDLPLIPIQIVRVEGAHFRLIIHPALDVQGVAESDIITQAHTLLEGWIREKPEQWLWLHRRWKLDD
ncbi:MAG: lysophospholipid acyltransferase family protein, partial [Bdellovibrionales bacterium]